jgi:hypothetical protein
MKSLTAKGTAPQTARGAGERKAYEILAPSAFFAVYFHQSRKSRFFAFRFNNN